jgi:radical SAM superfamily enzyme YgiQ (UPF0313 family)
MKPLFLFVRPPRPLWPFNGPSTAFWPPLAFASLAAALREHVPGVRVAILDAPALSMGWTTLTRHLRSLQPAFIAIGEEAVSCVEGLRIAKLAKSLGARVVAGGCFFSHTAPQLLATGLIDFVVHGEGELTIVELTHALLDGDNQPLRAIAGISFRDGEEVVFTGPRELIADLDRLPFPAYDLLPMHRYGAASRHHPNLAGIELGRGCTHGCSFCILWRQMGRSQSNHPVPCLRVKSAERLLEEIRILMDRHQRRYLGWVDPCFNADPHTPARLSELLLRENRIVHQSAWVRADYVLRDHDSGALKLCCQSGFNEAYLGIERLDPSELARLGKGNLNGEARRAVEILHTTYPEVFTVGSLIYGLPWDTLQTVRSLFQSAEQLPLDQIFFIPFTPLPGTPFWEPHMWDGTGEKFRSFDFLALPGSGVATAALSSEIAWSYLFRWPRQRLVNLMSGLLSRNPRRRGITRHLLQRSVPVMLPAAFHRRPKSAGGMVYPAWYEN